MGNMIDEAKSTLASSIPLMRGDQDPAADRHAHEQQVPTKVYSSSSVRRGARGAVSQQDIDFALERLGKDNPGYFREDFDPVRHILAKLPGGLNDDQLRDQADALYETAFVLQRGLSKHVVEHYNEFVAGMNQVTDIIRTTQISTVIAKNGRRYLSEAEAEVKVSMSTFINCNM